MISIYPRPLGQKKSYDLVNFAHKIAPMTEFEVINRVVDVDGTND